MPRKSKTASKTATSARNQERDIEAGDYIVHQKAVSFEEDCRPSSGGKSKKRDSSPRSPSSIKTSPTEISEDSIDTPRSSSGPSVITIEHRVKQKKSNKLLKMLLKPSIMATVAVIMLLTGGTAFFFTRFLTIPGLNDQIERLEGEVSRLSQEVDQLEDQVDELETQVDRLGTEVDRLAKENDRFAKLNEELKENVAAYIEENQKLNASLAEFQDLNSQLNSTLGDLHLINDMLEGQNNEYAGLNDELNTTVRTFGEQIDRLEALAGNLTASNRELREMNEELLNETARLRTLKDDLNDTVVALDGEVAELGSENERLASLNADLTLLVSFLNDTAIGIQGSYEDIAAFLAEQITAYQVLALETLQNLYLQRISRWDCDWRSYFLTEPFATNYTRPIGATSYSKVLKYVDERVLSELCLDDADFEQYLRLEFDAPSQMTAHQLLSSVSTYTTKALQFYFPVNNSTLGVTSDDWAEAGFDCEKLEQRYRHI